MATHRGTIPSQWAHVATVQGAFRLLQGAAVVRQQHIYRQLDSSVMEYTRYAERRDGSSVDCWVQVCARMSGKLGSTVR
jgi:hypothetical protein